MKINAEIDPRTARYIDLALAEAEMKNADYLILELNTFGGRVDNADHIVSKLLEIKKPILAFINKNAASAGAWISLACDSIYMAKGASVGAATVVVQDGKEAPDKYQSYMRGKMRSAAEANKRNPKIAEAMVDPSVEVEGINKKGQVITFSTSEAIKNGYCEAEVNTVEDILKRNRIDDYQLIAFELSNLEKFISIFLNPFISGILLLIMIGGIYFEMKTPGIGFPLFAAILAGIFYFVPYYLNGLAENWEAAVLVLGVVLLMIEIFAIPGFGLVGISGLVLIFGSLLLMMLNNQGFDFSYVSWVEFNQSFFSLALAIVASVLLVLYALPKVLSNRRFKDIALQTAQSSEDGFISASLNQKMTGKFGIAYTVLRPSGKVKVENVLYNASTLGDFIEKDSEIEVIGQEGASLRVKKK